jgi:hypothetical protein
VLGVPLLAVPAVRALPAGRVGREVMDAGSALWSVVSGAPQGGARRTPELLRLVGQPLVLAMVLCLTVLLAGYAASALRGRRRQRPPTAADGSESAR